MLPFIIIKAWTDSPVYCRTLQSTHYLKSMWLMTKIVPCGVSTMC